MVRSRSTAECGKILSLMRFGGFEVDLISDGTMALDGGAMFGVVPRVIWEKRIQPDAQNRIRLGLNCLLLRDGIDNVLVDTGCGFKYSEKELRMYGIDHRSSLMEGIARAGVSPEEVTLVVNTHLHFDHCGGNTLEVEGELVPAFPAARYLVQSQEFESAELPNERTRASYLKENWAPLVKTGQLELVDGESEILPGLFVEPTPGHTLGHQSVRLSGPEGTLFFLGDLCPTSAHVPLAWAMGYDLYPLEVLETRRVVYRRALSENWRLLFEHDAEAPLGELELSDGRYRCRSLDWSASDH